MPGYAKREKDEDADGFHADDYESRRSGRRHGGEKSGRRRRREEESAAKAEDELDDDDFDEPFPDAKPSAERSEIDAKLATFRLSALHVYGLDFLKTEHMDEIFSQFTHRFIEWINDSSANIVFADAAQAQRALDALSFPKPGDEPWRRTPDILVSEDMPPIYLQMRLACTSDCKRPRKAMPPLNASSAKRPRVAGKDPSTRKQGPTPEEVEMRAKRAKRFEDWLKDATASAKDADDGKPAAPAKSQAEGEAQAPAAAVGDAGDDSPKETAEECRAREDAAAAKRALRFKDWLPPQVPPPAAEEGKAPGGQATETAEERRAREDAAAAKRALRFKEWLEPAVGAKDDAKDAQQLAEVSGGIAVQAAEEGAKEP